MTPSVDGRKAPWDSGLQNERTSLAWARTSLAFTVAGMVLVRLLANESPALAMASAALLLPVSLATVRLAWLRYDIAHRHLHTRMPLPGAGLPTALTIMVTALGACAIIYILIAGSSPIVSAH